VAGGIILEDLLNRIISKLDNLEQGQKDLGERLDNRIDKLEIRMENEVFDKMAALFDGYLHNAEVLAEHTIILNEHTKVLAEHTIILNEHTKVLTEHTIILNEHTKVLDEHTIILDRIEDKISSHDIQIHVLDKTKSNKRKLK
jgi:hypothetical protein